MSLSATEWLLRPTTAIHCSGSVHVYIKVNKTNHEWELAHKFSLTRLHSSAYTIAIHWSRIAAIAAVALFCSENEDRKVSRYSNWYRTAAMQMAERKRKALISDCTNFLTPFVADCRDYLVVETSLKRKWAVAKAVKTWWVHFDKLI